MPPGGKMYRFPGRFGENVLPYGRHQCLPYSKDAVRADTFKQQFIWASSWSADFANPAGGGGDAALLDAAEGGV